MGKHCAAIGCTNTNKKLKTKTLKEGVTFHAFPHQHPTILKEWIERLRRTDFNPTNYSFLCSEHFTEDDFEYQPFTGMRMIKKGAVPSKFILNSNAGGQKRQRTSEELGSIDNMPKCIIPNCGSQSPTPMFKFPRRILNLPKGADAFFTPCRRSLWLNAAQLQEHMLKTHDRVCCRHFLSGQPASRDAYDHIDWVPQMYLGNETEPMIGELLDRFHDNRNATATTTAIMTTTSNNGKTATTTTSSTASPDITDTTALHQDMHLATFEPAPKQQQKQYQQQQHTNTPTQFCNLPNKLLSSHKMSFLSLGLQKNYANGIVLEKKDIVSKDINNQPKSVAPMVNQICIMDKDIGNGYNTKTVSLISNQVSPTKNDHITAQDFGNEQPVSPTTDTFSLSNVRQIEAEKEEIDKWSDVKWFYSHLPYEVLGACLRCHGRNIAWEKENKRSSATARKSKKTYLCEFCGRFSQSSSALVQHMRRDHTKEKPYSCAECGKGFSTSYELKAHIATHSNLRPHSCPVCSLAFKQIKTLQKHKLTHRTDTPYRCVPCAKNYKHRESLKLHQKIVHDK